MLVDVEIPSTSAQAGQNNQTISSTQYEADALQTCAAPQVSWSGTNCCELHASPCIQLIMWVADMAATLTTLR